MSDYTAWFNGHDLSALFVISPPERNLVTWEPNLVSMPSGYGSLSAGIKAQAMEIRLRLTTFAETLEERLDALGTLSSWISVYEPRKLYLTDERYEQDELNNYYLFRYAVPNGTPKVTHALNAATAEVVFICPDARALIDYGPWSQGISIIQSLDFDSSTGYDGVPVGTAPTEARISLNEVCGDSDGTFEMQITCYHTEDGSSYLDVMPDFGGTITLDVASNAYATVLINSETRTYQLNDRPYPLPPNNDWIRFIGGHRVTVEVTKGSCEESTIIYVPRWW